MGKAPISSRTSPSCRGISCYLVFVPVYFKVSMYFTLLKPFSSRHQLMLRKSQFIFRAGFLNFRCTCIWAFYEHTEFRMNNLTNIAPVRLCSWRDDSHTLYRFSSIQNRVLRPRYYKRPVAILLAMEGAQGQLVSGIARNEITVRDQMRLKNEAKCPQEGLRMRHKGVW